MVVDEATVAQWVTDLRVGDDSRQAAARAALKRLGPDNSQAIMPLVEGLYDEGVRDTVAEALQRVKAVPFLTHALTVERDNEKRYRILTNLERILALTPVTDEAFPCVDPLIEVLVSSKKVDFQIDASAALLHIGIRAVPGLVRALGDPKDVDMRLAGAGMLGQLHADGANGVSALTTALKDSNREVRHAAAFALGEIGPKAAPAIPSLLVMARSYGKAGQYDPERTVDGTAVEALGKIGDAAVPGLIGILKDREQKEVRKFVLDAVTHIGLGAAAAVPVLVEVLSDEEDWVGASQALRFIGAASAPALAKALKAGNPAVRDRALQCLGEMGASAKDAVPAIGELVENKVFDLQTRIAGANALQYIGADAKSAVPSLIDGLRSKEPSLRFACAEALQPIGPEARRAVPALCDLLKESIADLRLSGANALRAIGPDARPAATVLQSLLQDGDPRVRDAARAALQSIGK